MEKKMTRLLSTSQLQVKSGFNVSWKLFLNLCSWRWLSPSRNLVKYLIPFRLRQPNMLPAVGLINFKIFFSKILGLKAFWISGSSLFHLIMTKIKFFLTAIWLPHGHFWAIIEGAVSLNRCHSLRFTFSTRRSPGAS